MQKLRTYRRKETKLLRYFASDRKHKSRNEKRTTKKKERKLPTIWNWLSLCQFYLLNDLGFVSNWFYLLTNFCFGISSHPRSLSSIRLFVCSTNFHYFLHIHRHKQNVGNRTHENNGKIEHCIYVCVCVFALGWLKIDGVICWYTTWFRKYPKRFFYLCLYHYILLHFHFFSSSNNEFMTHKNLTKTQWLCSYSAWKNSI